MSFEPNVSTRKLCNWKKIGKRRTRWVVESVARCSLDDSPTDDPNPRITLQVHDARGTEELLRERAVTISDPVKFYDEKFWVGGLLDSEGNKIWFCSYA
jgi:hypothetical protein